MTAQDFLTKAHAQISNEPMDRVSANTKALLPNAVYDPHCHVFDRNCVTPIYFLLRILGEILVDDDFAQIPDAADSLRTNNEDLYKKIENNTDDHVSFNDIRDSIEALNSHLDSNPSSFKGKRGVLRGILSAIRIFFGKKFDTNEAVLDHYLRKFAVKNLSPFNNDGSTFITGILMMDIEKGWKRRPNTTVDEQMRQLLELVDSHPILPFFSIDPRRADDDSNNLYDLFLEAFPSSGPSFFGVKAYPALGYLPDDDRLRPIFEICQAKNIPVVTHCGGNIISTFKDSIDSIIDGQNVLTVNPNRKSFATQLNNPDKWVPVLERFPKLKLNFGHFGGNDVWENAASPNAHRITEIIDLMDRFEGVYADFSFNVISPDSYGKFLNVLNTNPLVKNRSMFGTDFWVVLGSGNLVKMQQEFIQQFTNHHDTLFKQVPNEYFFKKMKTPTPVIPPVPVTPPIPVIPSVPVTP